MKKIISLILCLLLAVSSFGAVLAEDEPTVEPTGEEISAPAADYVLRSGNKVLTVSADGTGLTMAEYSSAVRAQLWRFDGGVIYNRLNNRALTVNGGVTLAANKGLDTQKWEFTAEGLLAYVGGGYLTVDENENLTVSQNGTVWEALTPQEIESAAQTQPGEEAAPVSVGGTMVLLQDGSTSVLAVGGDNVSLTTVPYEIGENGQLWTFAKNGTAYNIRSNATGSYVDVSGSSLNPGGQLILWRGTGGDNQKWEVEQENGRCYVKSVLSGLYMTVQNGSVTQQTKENSTVWRLMSLDEINTAFLAGTGNSEAFDNRCRLMSNLGVITGDRRFSENAVVTNRDALTMAVRLVTGGGDFAPGVTGFEDVDPSDELSGYILQGLGMGLIGSGSKFYPDYAARADELVSMLVRGLGLGSLVTSYGGYMGVAYHCGLLKGVSAFEDNTLTYNQLFKIFSNALSAQLPFVTYTDKGVLYTMDGGKTLMEVTWDVTVLRKAEITSVSYSDGRFTAVYDGDEYELEIPENYKNVEFKGFLADVWLDSEDRVLNIDVYAGTTLSYGYITSVNGVDDTEASFNPDLVDNFSLNYARGSYRVANDVKITVDGSDSYGSVELVGAFVRAAVRGGRVKYMDIYRMTEGGLFREADDDSLTYLIGERTKVRLRGLAYRDNVEVVLNGRPADIRSLPYNAVIDFCDSGDLLFIAASVNTASGEFTISDGEMYNIGDDQFDMSNPFGVIYYSSDMGETYTANEEVRRGLLNGTVTAYLDLSGSIRYIRGEKNTNSVIGIITDMRVSRFGGEVSDIESMTVFSDYSGVMNNQTFALDLTKKSPVSEDDLKELFASKRAVDNAAFEFRINGGKIKQITELDWLECSDNAKNNVSAQVRGALVDDYGQERVDELFADPNVFITGWTMGRDYSLGRINFQARTSAGDDYTLMCDGGVPSYVMAYDADNDFRPREIGWNDYRNTNFDRSFLKVGFLKDNKEHMYPDLVYILSGGRSSLVSSWDVHGIVKGITEEITDRMEEHFTIQLLEPGGAINSYTVERDEDMVGYLDGVRPKRGSAVTLSVHGSYEKIYYNIYGEALSEEEAWELEDAGDYVELREVYNSNGYASVAKVWDMPNEIGRFNNEYSVTYVDNIYKIDGNLMYYKDSASGAIQPYSSTGGSLFIMEDPSHYLMFDYEDFRRGYLEEPIDLDSIATEAYGGQSDKLLIFSVSRGRYPKIILRMPDDWEP